MRAEEGNGRTHEPSLRELTAELDGLREVLFAKLQAQIDKIEVLDRLYKERDDSRRVAVDAALTAVKEQTKASFEASEKAIVKAEEAQKSYNQSHNDLALRMDDQSKATMPRSETESRFHSIENQVNEVRTALAGGSALVTGGRQALETRRSDVLALISILGFLAMLGFQMFGRR